MTMTSTNGDGDGDGDLIVDDRRLAAGALLGSFRGDTAPEWLLDQVMYGLGGVVLFADNIVDDDQLRALCMSLRAARGDVVIAVDEEAGDVTRLDARTGSSLPGHAVLGAVDDVATTAEIASLLGLRLADLGITLNLAPCADINSNPSSPIVGTRSFSAAADVAERHVPAFVAALQESGVAACVKHLPGHGGTSLDSHLAAPLIDETLETLLAKALRPFVAAIGAGVDCVMTGHLVVAAVDDSPASLSARWTDILRRTLGFDGVIVTDALDMAAVSGDYGTTTGLPPTSVEALAAGADLLCLASKLDREPIEATIAAIVAALRTGRLDRAAMESSRSRIDAMHRRNAVTRHEVLPAGAEAVARVGLSAASRALQIEGQVPRSSHGHIIECRPVANLAIGTTRWGLVEHLGGTGWFGQQLHPGQQPDYPDLVELAGSLVVIVRDSARDPWQQTVIDHCAEARPDVIVVEMGWPGQRRRTVTNRICTFGASRASSAAALQRLTGRSTGPSHHPDEARTEKTT
jgi:beta-N-acetylhexosaminidase